MSNARLALLSVVCLLGPACDEAGPEDDEKPGESAAQGTGTKAVGPDSPAPAQTADDVAAAARSVTQARDLNQPWVGMIPWTIDEKHLPSCPDGYEYIKFDDEDWSNRNKLYIDGRDLSHRNSALGGIQRVPSPRRAGGNTKFVYCKKIVSRLPTLAFDYAVISAGNVCPAGSFRFSRRWDNEDSSNHNSWSADIAPNSSGRGSNGWSWIHFCFVPGQAGAPIWDPSLDVWIVFAARDVKPHGFVNGFMYTDDEDDNNNNQYSVPAASQPYSARMQAIISSGKNTTLRFAAKAIEHKDYGNLSSCVDQNVIASILYGNAVAVLAAEGFVDPVGWGFAGAAVGVGLFIQVYCWW